ncbi:FecR family protein [Paraglaciecola hydrolytica]|uniref:Transmembrane sensor n=1 Tax=Paraglaciecola hydrolytica TaxID=1799789 RepID=A0A136A5L2_9ALTE|nr:FecR domain-containing protein [Paraglaciecola hydrolytica]KXI30410.1 transmembrane sensor [Paraglaciecola hydrolytica]
MTNIKAFNRKEDIQLQACEWISRIDRGLSPDEQHTLQNWTTISESHRQILFEMAQTWDDLSVLNELNGLMPLERIDGQARYTQPHKILWPLAASIGFLMVSVLTWLVFNPSQIHSTEQLITRLSTEVGEQKPVMLTDGSVVYLNTNSELQIDFSASRRTIQLIKGEAHFEVAHDENRPFVVATAHNTVTAVGTAFNVQLLDNQRFELLVTEGTVLVQNAQQLRIDETSNTPNKALQGTGTLLSAGQKAMVAAEDPQAVSLSLEQMQNELAWRQGIVVFNGEPLAEAMIEISRYMPVHFELADEQVKQQRVAGFFKAGDIDGLLAALQNNFNIRYRKLDEYTIQLLSSN